MIPAPPIKILLVDDDPALLTVLETGLALNGQHQVTAVTQAAEARGLLEREEHDLLVADFSLGHPEINGLTLLQTAQQCARPPLVVIITAYASLQVTLQSIQLGAYDFLTKPFQIEELQLVVRNAAECVRLKREASVLREHVGALAEALEMIGQQNREMLDRIRQYERGGDGSDTNPPSSYAAVMDGPAVHELKRRRMREQLGSYLRMSETIAEQLTRERQRIESLVEIGLIPESTYRRALQGGRLGESEG